MNKPKPIKAIIVDDEVDAQDVLSTLIALSPHNIDIVSVCSNVEEAVTAIKELNPAIVFLDIEMPNYAGYELLRFFDHITFEIIFITAYNQYAIKAFELAATDYLLKPVNRLRLEQAIDKVVHKLKLTDSARAYQALRHNLSVKENEDLKIVVALLNEKRVLYLKDIICIQGQGSYATIYLSNKETLLISKTIKYFEQLLPAESTFFRAQKSWLLNLRHIQSYHLSKGDVVLSNGVVARLSPQRSHDFLEKMEIL